MITHANPRDAQDESDSALPEVGNEMACSLWKGPVLASIEEGGADANEEESPFNVPWQLARDPNRFKSSMDLRRFCNAPRNVFEKTEILIVAHETT